MFEHLKPIIRYYTASRHVEIASAYDAAQSLSRVLELNSSGEIRVREKRDKLIAVGAQWGPRSNVLPVFEGRFQQRDERVILTGEIAIDSGIRMVLGMIGFAICVFFPVSGWLGGQPVHAFDFVAPLVFFGLLVFGFLIGKNDAAKITEHLTSVLVGDDCT